MNIEDLYTILLSDNPSDNIRIYENKIYNMIPDLKACKGFKQNSEWHVYDVYEHILHVVDNVPPNLVMRLSALFHDIGKPYSYTEDTNGIGHFYGHWEVSQKIFESFAQKYNIDKEVSNQVSNLIYYHDINIFKLDDNELIKMIQKLGDKGIENLYELKKADLLAQNEKIHYVLDEYPRQKKKILAKIKKMSYNIWH